MRNRFDFSEVIVSFKTLFMFSVMSVLCFLTGCAGRNSMEFIPQQESYIVDPVSFSNSMSYNRLDREKADPNYYGKLHISALSNGKDEMMLEIRKEKNEKYTRYWANKNLFATSSNRGDLALSYDKRRDLWLGVELKMDMHQMVPSYHTKKHNKSLLKNPKTLFKD